MFDSAYPSNANGMFAPHNAYVAGETVFFEASEPREEFRRQRLGLYLLSDLFSANYMGKTRYVKDRRLVSLARDKTIRFTGETFDQWDLDVLLHCAMRTAVSPDNAGKIHVDLAGLLHDLGLRNYEENRDRVYSSLFRLHTGSLVIEGKGYRYMTRLIDRVLLDQSRERCLVEVNGDVVNSLRCERNLARMIENRLDLKRCGLAKWLHGAVIVFKGGLRADISSLHRLSGASSRIRYIFPRMLGKSLQLMERHGVIDFWQIDGHRLMVRPGSQQRLNAACGVIGYDLA